MGHRVEEKTWAERVAIISSLMGGDAHLSVKINMSTHTIARWKVGKHQPVKIARDALEALEKALGL